LAEKLEHHEGSVVRCGVSMADETNFQIVDEDSVFNVNYAQFLEHKGLAKHGAKYHVVSIIGGQSSGKSTLLNRMFDTPFQVMDASKRQQTTKGIWCAPSKNSHILVMDVEGTDGREREDQKAFEGRSALFCLALTDVMMVNMWTHEIGRHQAANLPLLRTVFEVHLRLVGGKDGGIPKKRTKPLLLFILRDWDESTPADSLGETIMADLGKIWTDISKPEGEEGSSLSDFFELEVECLPHYRFQKQEWSDKVADVSARFVDAGHPKFVFKERGEKEVPADGFAEFATDLWDKIKKNEELDLPTQRKMLAMVRCDRRRKALVETLKENDEEWEKVGAEEFKAKVEQRIAEMVVEFDKYTAGYDEEVVAEGREKLGRDAWPILKKRFDVLVRELRLEAEEESKDRLTALLPTDASLPERGFTREVDKLKKQVLMDLEEKVEMLTPAGAPWTEQLYAEEGPMRLLHKYLNIKERELKQTLGNQVKTTVRKDLERMLAGKLVQRLDRADPSMWEGIRADKTECLGVALLKLQPVLEDVGLWKEEGEQIKKDFSKLAHDAVHDRVQDKASEDSLADKIFNRFDQKMNMKKSRTWLFWDTPVKEFEEGKRQAMHLLNMFEASQLYPDNEWPIGLTPPTFIDGDRKQALIDAFEEKIQPELKWAMDSKASNSTSNWMMIGGLVIVLGWDEAWWLLSNPLYLFLFLALIFASAIAYFLKFMGDWPQLLAVVTSKLAELAAPKPGATPGGGSSKDLNSLENKSGRQLRSEGQRPSTFPAAAVPTKIE